MLQPFLWTLSWGGPNATCTGNEPTFWTRLSKFILEASKLVGAYTSVMGATSSLPLSNLDSSLGYISVGDSQLQAWCFELVKCTPFMLE